MPTSKPHSDALSRLAGQLDLPAGFSSLSPTEKLRTLMDLPDPGRVIGALRPDELYFMIRSIGIEDAHSLLAYSDPDQRKAFVDMDSWSGWSYQPERFDRILDMISGISIELAADLVNRADAEQLALHLFKRCTVTLTRDEEDNPSGTDHSFLSPDGTFLFTCRKPEDIPAVRRLLDVMFAVGIEFAQEIIFGGMYDTASSLEEQAFRFRDGRLQDFGFPAFDDRHEIYEPFDREGLARRIAAELNDASPGRSIDRRSRPLGLVLQSRGKGLFLWDAVTRLEDDGNVAAFAGDLLFLVNRVMGVRHDDLSRERSWEDTAEHCLRMASLGLEDLSGGDPEEAAAILPGVAPVELYRNAIEMLRPLNLAAISATRLSGGMSGLDVLGERRAEAIRAALSFPPLFWTGLEGGGSVTSRDFSDRGEAHLAMSNVTQSRDVLRFARDEMGFDIAGDEPVAGSMSAVPTLANVIATAWARAVLGEKPSPEPLSGNNVRDLMAAAFESGRIRPALRASPFGEGPVADFLDEALDAVEETLGNLDPSKPVDTRFLGDALIVSLD